MKTHIKGIFTLIIFLLMATSVNVHAATIGTSQFKDELNIKNTIQKFFTNELDTIKTKKSIHSDNIIVNKDLQEYYDLTNDYYAAWYSKIDENLTEYKIYIDYANIKINENSCVIALTKGTDMIFDTDANIPQQARGDKYTFTLNKVNNEWLIEGIVSPDDLEIAATQKKEINTAVKNTANKLNNLKTAYNNIDTKISKMNTSEQTNNNSLVEPKSLVESNALTAIAYYDRLAVYNYALKWYNSYNPAYPFWSDADCTNFASQCVISGGYSQQRPAWYAVTASDCSSSWINVVDFYNYVVSPTGPGLPTVASNMSRGDVIQLFNSITGRWDHSVIQTSVGATIKYAAHSSPRMDYALSNVYPSIKYTDVRYIKILN